ncbi:hypothetical protein IZ6_24360 [Terrihabitans soli]|uniref:DUF1275 domain-containing protein n=1 Tax=Terrihabitans soli TaxID=708113 RepID=A0A6S6QXF5_9HYPH|nr:YoaK family protein [Terrihabitans soli]BCJ91701.1 hypothetical protein IZ6_24360 [Terrihabitans soli]
MIRTPKSLQGLAICLSALAGFVDALGFLKLGGFFVSFMSGNSTRMSVGLTEGSQDFAIAGALIGTFLIGVIFGSMVAHLAHANRRVAVLAFVTLLLATGALLNMYGPAWAAIGAVVLAMGSENAVFQRDGEVTIGLTYMTGTLVKLGQRLTNALLGGPRFAWLPYLALWCGLIAGAALGAFVYPKIGFSALWFAAAAAALLCLWSMFLPADDLDA